MNGTSTTSSVAADAATVKKIGGPDTGHVGAICDAPDCRDINGRPWQVWYSRRTVEGYSLAERDAAAHNRVRHGAVTA